MTSHGQKVRLLKAENAKHGRRLRLIHEADPLDHPKQPRRVWRSNTHLVQEFLEGERIRITVNRTELAASGRWADGITWDQLERIKSEIGHGDRWAVELYPPDAEVVDVANMRHLWLLTEAPSFAWTREKGPTP